MRSGIFLAPIAASYGVARVAAPALWQPAGWSGVPVYVAQIAVVGTVAALLCGRAVRRVLPLVSLLNLTLVFPDRAPSRFGLALRSGTIRQLQHGTTRLPSDHQQAAEELVTMVTALGRHERLTRGHTERVRAHSDVIAEQLGLSAQDRELLTWAALVHDVGKLTVPAEILASDGRPSEEEWAILSQHPVAGAEMVEPLAGWLGEWRLAAGQHHERWDGQGYPEGLAGTQISLAGRIVAVADAFDVITANRSYKKAMAPEAAREEMVRCAGSQFDPEIVRAILEASMAMPRSRFAFLGWFGELGGRSALPRGLAQGMSTVLTASALLVAAATSGAVTPYEPEDANQLALTAPDSLWEAGTSPGSPTGSTTVDLSGVPPTPVGSASTTTVSRASSVTITTTGATKSSTTAATIDSTSTTSPNSTTSSAPASTTTTRAITTATTTTTAATTTTVPPALSAWELGNSGSGNTTSQALLALAGGLDSGALPNYDTDRDDDPGLLISKGNGLSETDRTKMQRWNADASTTRIQGNVTLDLWVATKDFDTGKTGRLVVGLYDCNSAAAACNLIASSSAQFNQATFGSDFGQVTIGFGSVDHTFAANRTLVLKVAATNSSDDDLWLAFGTTSYPTQLNT